MTPDPYKASANPSNPTSWNRYAYVSGDPINANDRTGLDGQLSSQDPGWCDDHPDDGSCTGGIYGSGYPCPAGEEFISGPNPCLNEIGPPPPPPPPTSVNPPSCFVALQYRPVQLWMDTPSGSVLQLFNHAYVVVGNQWDQVSVLEGLPQQLNFPWGNLTANQLKFNNDGTVANDPNDHPLSDAIQGVTGANNVNACDLVSSLIYDTNNFDALTGGPHQYGGVVDNSNSFASYILDQVGLNYGQPPQTPGWGDFNGLLRPLP